ncbi:MAG: hypothetical protein A3E82_00695 [Gammaproteobacteria bacterium RIFCSPHIGHO2_12_FULL_38_11]|nr:MAG: hypothetical protein A3E82_00695 [Gammaproteobacteria bacterium RIFCSPHIGHO2_12_FULL_38_11]
MKLGLGTVQFGLDYGVSNVSGRVSQTQVESILAVAKQHDVNLLDTASQYGDSEKVLGTVAQHNDYFNVVTKTPSFLKYDVLTAMHALSLKNTFQQSILNLNRSGCYGLLVHQADDLLKPGSDYLMDALLELKSCGRVHKIGASVYSAQQIDRLLDRYHDIDIIQLPLNVLDQRLIQSGHLKKLKERQIEIHVRSIFLQGLLLMDVTKLNTFFNPFASHLQSYFNAITKLVLSPLQAAILFVKQIKEIDRMIVGVTSEMEFNQIIGAYNNTPNAVIDFSFASTDNEQYINPVNWRLTQ